MRLNKSRNRGDVPASTKMGLTDLRRQKDVPGDILKTLQRSLRRYKDIPSTPQIYESEIPFSLDNLFSNKQTFVFQ